MFTICILRRISRLMVRATVTKWGRRLFKVALKLKKTFSKFLEMDGQNFMKTWLGPFEFLEGSDRTIVQQKDLFGEHSSHLSIFSFSKKASKEF